MKYLLTTENLTTGEIVNEQTFEHWPCKEAWDIELKDYNLKCKITTI